MVNRVCRKGRCFPSVCMTVARSHIRLFVFLVSPPTKWTFLRSPSRLLFRFSFLFRAVFFRVDVFLCDQCLLPCRRTPLQMCYGLTHPLAFRHRTLRTLLSCLLMFSPSFHRYLVLLTLFFAPRSRLHTLRSSFFSVFLHPFPASLFFLHRRFVSCFLHRSPCQPCLN